MPITVIAKNNTGSTDVTLLDLGVIVPYPGQLELVGTNGIFSFVDVASSQDLYDAVDAETIVINDGTDDLSKANGLDHVSLETKYEDDTEDAASHYDTSDFTTDFAAENLSNLATKNHSSLDSVTADQHHARDHASTHGEGAADPLKLDDLATPDDNTDLNASTSRHGLLSKLPGGSSNFLREDGSWAAPAGGGDVIGPASSVDNALPKFDGTTGKTLQESGIIVDDSDNLTNVGTINSVDVADHNARHESGGADEIKLDDLAAPDDNTDLDASTSKHGLLLKLGGGTANFLRADGTWALPPDTDISSYDHVITVAESGADFTSVQDAIDAETPLSTEKELVLIAPGLYEEALTLKLNVDLCGLNGGFGNSVIVKENDIASGGLINQSLSATTVATINNITFQSENNLGTPTQSLYYLIEAGVSGYTCSLFFQNCVFVGYSYGAYGIGALKATGSYATQVDFDSCQLGIIQLGAGQDSPMIDFTSTSALGLRGSFLIDYSLSTFATARVPIKITNTSDNFIRGNEFQITIDGNDLTLFDLNYTPSSAKKTLIDNNHFLIASDGSDDFLYLDVATNANGTILSSGNVIDNNGGGFGSYKRFNQDAGVLISKFDSFTFDDAVAETSPTTSGATVEIVNEIQGDLWTTGLFNTVDIEDHGSRHESGGDDAIKLDDLTAPDDNTDLNASTSRHGLLLKLGGGTTNFLRADGTWNAPAGGGGNVLEDYDNIFAVAESGAEYSTIAAALSAASPTGDERFVVLVAPGRYNEAVTLKDKVDIIGLGGLPEDVLIYKIDSGAVVLNGSASGGSANVANVTFDSDESSGSLAELVDFANSTTAVAAYKFFNCKFDFFFDDEEFAAVTGSSTYDIDLDFLNCEFNVTHEYVSTSEAAQSLFNLNVAGGDVNVLDSVININTNPYGGFILFTHSNIMTGKTTFRNNKINAVVGSRHQATFTVFSTKNDGGLFQAKGNIVNLESSGTSSSRSFCFMSLGSDNADTGAKSNDNVVTMNGGYLHRAYAAWNGILRASGDVFDSDDVTPVIYDGGAVELEYSCVLTPGTLTTSVDLKADGGSVSLINHSARHESGGGDAIKLDDLSAPDDNTDLNASTSNHGLLLKLAGGSTTFLRADGTWATPASGGSPNIAIGHMTRNSGTSGTTSYVKHQWDTIYEETDDSFVDCDTTNNRIYARVDGLYILSYGTRFYCTTNYERTGYAIPYFNGASDGVRGYTSAYASQIWGAGAGSYPSIAFPVELSADDYVELYCKVSLSGGISYGLSANFSLTLIQDLS